jgi:hypothetical protein
MEITACNDDPTCACKNGLVDALNCLQMGGSQLSCFSGALSNQLLGNLVFCVGGACSTQCGAAPRPDGGGNDGGDGGDGGSSDAAEGG